ncbi:MAG: cupin domain-containing protein [Myxococcales bacterium]|nr:cupin domain-containing protein [Myxococcales bacterium]
MTIYSNSAFFPNVLPGLAHRTRAGAEHGLERLAVWAQQIDPQGATPPHTHDCEEVVLIQDGEGTLILDGEELRFQGGDTIVVPPSAPHQIINTGEAVLILIAAFSTAKVCVKLPDGTPLDLPWQ